MIYRTDPLSLRDPRQTEPTGLANGARVALKVTMGEQGISKTGSCLVSGPDLERGAFLEGNDRGARASTWGRSSTVEQRIVYPQVASSNLVVLVRPPSTSGLGRGPFKAEALGSNPAGGIR